MKNRDVAKVVDVLKKGGLAVLPTDTIYGVHCTALNKQAVEKVYRIRKRDSNKPCIVLISSIEQVESFGVDLDKHAREFLEKIWPGKVSVVFEIEKSYQDEFRFLHRNTGSLGFRMPGLECLREIVDHVGPLISTSANLEGAPPAKNIKEAKDYFGDKIGFYLDGGELDSAPSTLVRIGHGKFEILREGEVDISGYLQKG